VLTSIFAARRAHHPLDQQSQQTAHEHPIDFWERFLHRRGCRGLPSQGAQQYLQVPLTCLVRLGLHLAQPLDNRDHGQQTINSRDRRIDLDPIQR